MNNRSPVHLPGPGRKGPPSQQAFQELHNLAQGQITNRMRQVETYIHEHPVTGIGAAFCTGIFLGWIIKRS